MFSQIASAINKIAKPCDKYVIGENRFVREGKFSFKKYVTFTCLKKGTSNRADLEDFIEDDINSEIDSLSRQAYSQQRKFINPQVYKDISTQYLKEIRYKANNNLLKNFKGMMVVAGDGSDFEIPNFEETREEFNIKDDCLNYRKPAMAKFSSIMDVLNGFILDGIIGDYHNGELPLMQENIKNIQNVINPEKTIFLFDRGYNALALYTQLTSLNSYFLVRLRSNTYKKERKSITEKDSEIKIKITGKRLSLFKDTDLKKEYKGENYLKLRIVTYTLENNEKETFLTNLPPETFTYQDIYKLYGMRWGIETNYNTMKNRLNIENYSGKKRLSIEQDIYAKFLCYNIFQFAESYLTNLINSKKRKKGVKQKYKIDQAHLIRKLKKYLPKMINNPTHDNVRKYLKKLIDSCLKSPNRDKKSKSRKRKKPQIRKFNMNYRPT